MRLDFPRSGFSIGCPEYVPRVEYPYHELDLLGRIVVQDITGSQCLVSLEVAGDPENPMTDRRMAVFEPVAKELVESKLMQCERCGAGVALLIFAPGATDPGRFEDDARRMY
jgi:hypothetical protein